MLSQTPNQLSPQAKRQEALRVAAQMFTQNPDWVTFFREILGVEGVARRLFTSQEEYLEFEHSPEFLEIQNMVAKLRNRNANTPDGQEPTRVITVRLPKSLHEALRAEAHDHKTSMNKLCISKLLQVLNEEANANAAATLASRATPPTPVQVQAQVPVAPQTIPMQQAPPAQQPPAPRPVAPAQRPAPPIPRPAPPIPRPVNQQPPAPAPNQGQGQTPPQTPNSPPRPTPAYKSPLSRPNNGYGQNYKG